MASGIPDLTGYPSFSRMCILALRSYMDKEGHNDMHNEMMRSMPRQVVPLGDALRTTMRPYLARYRSDLLAQLDALPDDDDETEETRANLGELIAILGAQLRYD